MRTVIGIDIGGTKISYALINNKGEIKSDIFIDFLTVGGLDKIIGCDDFGDDRLFVC